MSQPIYVIFIRFYCPSKNFIADNGSTDTFLTARSAYLRLYVDTATQSVVRLY